MSRSKKEAEQAGVAVSETKHQMKRRSPWHDYRKAGTYMLTMVVAGRQPLLGRLVVEPCDKSQGTVAAQVELSELGKAICREEIAKISKYHPDLETWKLCVMPDHIHMIIRVKRDLPEGKHLGAVVRSFKGGCSRAWWRIRPCDESQGTVAAAQGTVTATQGAEAAAQGTVAAATCPREATVPVDSSTGPKASLFEPGYNDKILLREGQLENWKRYLDDNPRRLAIKRLYPDLFKVVSNAALVFHHGCDAPASRGNRGSDLPMSNCQMVGNRFLLDIPEKAAVVVHRAYSDEEYARYCEQWLTCGEAGGVLVSAAISPREKTVMREAMDRGYRIILLRENGFPPLYKPAGEAFAACSEGRLLQISPWPYHTERKTISREQCLQLNRLAEQIADGVVGI